MITLKVYLVYSIISISYYCYVSPLFLFHYWSFEHISEVLTFSIDTTDILISGWHFIAWCFLFHGLHFATTLRVLNPVLCFHMTSFNYGTKWVRNVGPTCRCHQSNIMSVTIFSVNIAPCVACS